MDELEIDGVIRTLSHLRPFVVTLDGKGKDGRDLRVAVSLGRHTISKSCARGVHDMLDENGKPRAFCEHRYAVSLALPEFARRMVQQNYFCWESTDRNRAVNYAVLDAAPGRFREMKDGEHQAVYFYLYPASGIDADVRLVITSSYRRWITFRRDRRRFNLVTQLRKCLYEQKRLP